MCLFRVIYYIVGIHWHRGRLASPPPQLAPVVAEEGEGVVEEPAGSGPAHDGADTGAHVGTVAVVRATAAGRFGGAVSAVVEARMGVGEQLGTLWAQCAVALLATAVEAHHRLDDTFLLRDARHAYSMV